jgi:phospholipid/cholesterol/gamma-HCH transport system substrate-binding protein
VRRNQRQRLSFFQVGLIAVIAAVVVTYLGFSRNIPFRHHYTVTATFKTANNIKPNSFVRIAGVNVGRVTEVNLVHPGDPAAEVKMRLDSKALPLHEDATFKIRPRIFLEGNFFVDVQPGTPSAPTTGDGHVFPVNQTSAPVQLDQILTTLQASTRKDLQKLLVELDTGLKNGGATGYNRSIPYWEPAYKNGAMLSDATLGQAEHDLSGYIKNAAVVARALDRFPTQLQSLITDLNTTASAFAVRDQQLEAAIAELPRTLSAGLPALRELNDSFPAVRRFVRSFRPAVRSSGPALDASVPFTHQLRLLVGKPELRGLVGDLRPTVPNLARLNKTTVPLYEQVRAASSCQNDVILPWSHDKIEDATFPSPGQVFEESTKGLAGLSGESRSGDANGQWFRVMLTGGNYAYPQGADRFLITGQPIQGVNPPPPAQRAPLRPDVPCETQERPDLRSTPAPPPPGRKVSTSGPGYAERYAKAQSAAVKWLKERVKVEGLQGSLKVSDEPVTSAGALKGLPGLGKAGRFKVEQPKKAKRSKGRRAR